MIVFITPLMLKNPIDMGAFWMIEYLSKGWLVEDEEDEQV